MQRCPFFCFVVSFFCLLLLVFACGKSQSPTPTSLNGTWIENSGRGDTLIFKTNLLEVRRGFEIRNGVRLPKAGSGLWSYQLGKKYQIEVNALLLSSSKSQTAHVELKDNLLYVSNFYELENSKYELRGFGRK